MAEYIERSAIKYEQWAVGPLNEPLMVVRKKTIDAIPAADVAPVVRWVSVNDELPEPETEVLIFASRNGFPIITTGSYEDGTITTEDSSWCWYDHDFDYDEEKDSYIIPEGWWEYKHYNGDDEFNHLIDDVVTHWMPMPKPPNCGAKMDLEVDG